jgi:predicted ATPase/DNA-binding CsgD family transcriptional regulator
MDAAQRDNSLSLPITRTSLIGREAQILAARTFLLEQAVPLLTLTGPGGVGKTRLALAIAHEVADAFSDGVVYVDLAPLAEPTLVLPTIARILEVPETPHHPLIAQLVTTLRSRHLLILLDNCEHLVDAVAGCVADLLAACRSLQVLATSRESLHIQGEQEFLVEPLLLPSPRDVASPDLVAQHAAVRLFVERAHAANPAFVLDAGNAAAVAKICCRLDGLPLAIELVAVRTKLLPPPTLLARLERRLPLLTDGPRDAPARQQTMRDAIAWSHDLLTPTEQALFRRLAVFSGGSTLDAAEGIVTLPQEPQIDIVEGLASLVDKSLLRRDLQRDEEPRLAMLETVREYAEALLAGSGEAERVRRRHAVWCLELVERAEPEMLGARQIIWLDRLEAEHDNFRAALARALERGETETGLRLAGALLRLWRWHGHLCEGRGWLERLLSAPGDVAPLTRAKALLALGVLTKMQQEFARAAPLFEEALATYREHGDIGSVARTLLHLGETMLGQGDRERARSYLEEALAAARAAGEHGYECVLLKTLGYIARLEGDYPRATRLLEEALTIGREIGFAFGAAEALAYLGETARDRGEDARAAELLTQGLTAFRELGDRVGVGLCLIGLASVAGGIGQVTPAARLFGAAEAIHDAVGHRPTPGEDPRRERVAAALRARLDEPAVAAAWAEGRALSLDQAGSEVLALAAIVATAAAAESRLAAFGLTPKEREVLNLLAEGLSNPEIADRLFVGRRTITTHVEHIFAKLDVRTRTEAAIVAREHGLC